MVLAVSVVIGTAGSVELCTFLGHGCGWARRCGEAGGGSGGTSEPGRLGCSGGFRGSPQCFSIILSPAAFLLTEQSCSVPDLALLLFEGVRSGTRRRRGPSTSAQAAGGPDRDRGAQRPHTRARGLYGCVWGLGVALCGLQYCYCYLQDGRQHGNEHPESYLPSWCRRRQRAQGRGVQPRPDHDCLGQKGN